jgi:hypothetical protein
VWSTQAAWSKDLAAPRFFSVLANRNLSRVRGDCNIYNKNF